MLPVCSQHRYSVIMERVNPYQTEHYDLEPSRIVSVLKRVPWFALVHASCIPVNAYFVVRTLTTPHPELHLDELPFVYVFLFSPLAVNVLLLFFHVKRETLGRRLAEWILGQ